MGVSHSSTVTNAASSISSTFFSTIVQVKQKCQSTATAVQNQAINVGTSDAVINACLAGGWSPADCKALQSTGLSVYNISQTAKVVSLTKCQMDSSIINQLQSSLTDQINQQLSQTTDGITGDVKSLISATQNTKDGTVNTTDVKNFVTSTFTLGATQDAINKVVATQNQALNVSNASNTQVHDISQAAQIEATLEVLQANSACASAIATLDSSNSQSLTTVDRGVADIASSIAGVFNNLFATLGAWIYVVGGIIALVILCSLCSCVATLFSGKTKQIAQGASTLLPNSTASAAASNILPEVPVASAAPISLPQSFASYLPSRQQIAALAKAFK